MATLDESRAPAPARVDRPGPSRPDTPAALPRSGRLPIGWILVLIVLVGANVVGWNITKVDLGTLISDAPKMDRFVKALVSPDIFTQNQEKLQISLDFVGLDDPDPAVTPVTAAAQAVPLLFVPDVPDTEQFQPIENAQPVDLKLTMSPGALAPGQTATVTGSGFPPNSDGILTWTHFGGFPKELVHYQADAAGSFSTQLTAPLDASQVSGGVKLSATSARNVGNIRFSKTFFDTAPFTDNNSIVVKTIETLFLALVGTTYGVILSIPLSFLAARNIMGHNPVGNSIYYGSRLLLNLLRSVEVLILAIIFAAWVGIGPFAGVLALMLHSVASLGKLYSEAIESIDAGPIEAVTATGANRLQVIVYAVVPQVIPQLIAFTLYRWDINVRMSTVVGLVGGGGVGFLLTQYINTLAWPQAAAALWVIAIVVVGLDLISARIRHSVL
jgi:phosphonate transport system permease protein